MQNINLSCSADNSGHKKQTKNCRSCGKDFDEHTTLPLRGRTRGSLVGFWGRGEAKHFPHLNAAVAVTLRALYFEGLSQDEAVDLVIRYVDGLPNNYADLHDGHFPAGGGCPEASLSLLYRGEFGMGGWILCGKTKSPEVAQEILERGELLGPDTCDWHYVEGLTLSKAKKGAACVDGEIRSYRPARSSIITSPRIHCTKPTPVPPETVDQEAPRVPAWTHRIACADLNDASYTFVLSLGYWKSKPVDVRVSQGIAVPDAIIFEMQENPDNRPPNPTVIDPLR